MKIIEPYVEAVTPFNEDAVLRRIEECGRVCYKSEAKLAANSAPGFVAGLIKRGHESVLEHCSFTVKFVCDRGVSHELVRHRIASYSQESTRYCNYGLGKFGSEITVIKPRNFAPEQLHIWERACRTAETAYFDLLAEGLLPENARAVLPTSLKTEVVMTANMREWRHFLRLRCSAKAHPDMRYLAHKLLDLFHEKLPVLFDDIWSEYHAVV